MYTIYIYTYTTYIYIWYICMYTIYIGTWCMYIYIWYMLGTNGRLVPNIKASASSLDKNAPWSERRVHALIFCASEERRRCWGERETARDRDRSSERARERESACVWERESERASESERVRELNAEAVTLPGWCVCVRFCAVGGESRMELFRRS